MRDRVPIVAALAAPLLVIGLLVVASMFVAPARAEVAASRAEVVQIHDRVAAAHERAERARNGAAEAHERARATVAQMRPSSADAHQRPSRHANSPWAVALLAAVAGLPLVLLLGIGLLIARAVKRDREATEYARLLNDTWRALDRMETRLTDLETIVMRNGP